VRTLSLRTLRGPRDSTLSGRPDYACRVVKLKTWDFEHHDYHVAISGEFVLRVGFYGIATITGRGQSSKIRTAKSYNALADAYHSAQETARDWINERVEARADPAP
jgi:hypothetical protein